MEKKIVQKKKKKYVITVIGGKRPGAVVNTQLSVSVGLLYGSIRIYFMLKMSSFDRERGWCNKAGLLGSFGE